jgi:FMN phosphatase YigB (HAD superfamily)
MQSNLRADGSKIEFLMRRTPKKALVCFDLGGVLIRIRRTWNECAEAAAIKTGLPETEVYDLMDFPLFDAYQMGSLATNEYLEGLAKYLETKPAMAKEVHMAILSESYEGTTDLIQELNAKDLDTGCLSNTNVLHWEEMVGSGRFPGIPQLHFKFTSHDIRLLKPDSAIFRLFDRETGYDGEHIVYFDDHQLNVDAARKNGWNAFYIDHEANPVVQMRKVLSDLELLAAQ